MKLSFPAHWDQCKSFIDVQSSRAKTQQSRPVIAISREEGAGGVAIAELTADLLNQAAKKIDAPPWSLFDRNLIEKVIEDEHLSRRLQRYMPEDVHPGIRNTVEEILGLHPSAWTLAEETTQTIRNLALLGNVILVGRGACVITANFHQTLRLRIVAPLEMRVQRVAEFYGLTQEKAAEKVRETDRARRRYLRHYFASDINAPLNYDLVLNTHRMSIEAAAHLIVTAIAAKSG